MVNQQMLPYPSLVAMGASKTSGYGCGYVVFKFSGLKFRDLRALVGPLWVRAIKDNIQCQEIRAA